MGNKTDRVGGGITSSPASGDSKQTGKLGHLEVAQVPPTQQTLAMGKFHGIKKGIGEKITDAITFKDWRVARKERKEMDNNNKKLIGNIENVQGLIEYTQELSKTLDTKSNIAKAEKTPLRKMSETEHLARKIARVTAFAFALVAGAAIFTALAIASGGTIPMLVVGGIGALIFF